MSDNAVIATLITAICVAGMFYVWTEHTERLEKIRAGIKVEEVKP